MVQHGELDFGILGEGYLRLSYANSAENIRKAIGTDRKRNPQRILDVLSEIGPDIIALQEADKRVGTRGAAVGWVE